MLGQIPNFDRLFFLKASLSLGGGGEPSLNKNGGGTTHFVQEWGGGHEILTWNGGGAGKYHLSLGGVQEIYLKDWKMGGGREPYPKKFSRCARISPNFKVLTIQISLFALLVIQMRDIQ